MWVYLMSFFGTVSFCYVYFKFLLLGTDTFQIVLWVNSFIIMNCSSFSLVVFLVLKTFSLFHINMLVQPILVSIVMVYLFSFCNQFVFILKQILCRHQSNLTICSLENVDHLYLIKLLVSSGLILYRFALFSSLSFLFFVPFLFFLPCLKLITFSISCYLP